MLLSDGKQMGLGLFISKLIVMKFHGDIDFISAHKKGSTFIFSMELEHDQDESQLEEQILNLASHRSPRFR